MGTRLCLEGQLNNFNIFRCLFKKFFNNYFLTSSILVNQTLIQSIMEWTMDAIIK